MAVRKQCLITLTQLKDIFGVQKNSLNAKGMEPTKDADGSVAYDLADFWDKFGDQYRQRPALEDTADHAALKLEKTREEARKLKLENDEREGLLCQSERVQSDFIRCMNAYADEVDGTVAAVKIADQTIPQSSLDVIATKLSKARNSGVEAIKKLAYEN